MTKIHDFKDIYSNVQLLYSAMRIPKMNQYQISEENYSTQS